MNKMFFVLTALAIHGVITAAELSKADKEFVKGRTLAAVERRNFKEAIKRGSCYSVYFPKRSEEIDITRGLKTVMQANRDHLLLYATCVSKLKALHPTTCPDLMDNIKKSETAEVECYYQPTSEVRIGCEKNKKSGFIKCSEEGEYIDYSSLPEERTDVHTPLDASLFDSLKTLYNFTNGKN